MTKDTKDKSAQWSGLPLSQIQRLSRLLCRSRARVDFLDGGKPSVAPGAGMAGRLISVLLEERDKHRDLSHTGPKGVIHTKVTRKALIAYLKATGRWTSGIDDRNMKRFLDGQCGIGAHAEKDQRRWLTVAYYLFESLLVGTNSDAVDHRCRQMASDMRSYLLGTTPGECSDYLGPERRWYRSPFDEAEVAQGMKRLASAAEQGARGLLAFVAGGEPPLQAYDSSDTPNSITRFTIDIAARGVDVYFVFPHSDIGPTQTRSGLRAILSRIGADSQYQAAIPHLHAMPLSPLILGTHSSLLLRRRWSGEYMDPATTYVYSALTLDDSLTQDLYIKWVPDDKSVNLLPCAFLASDAATAHFQEWFSMFRHSVALPVWLSSVTDPPLASKRMPR